MLDFLVTGKARRRLLLLLWVENGSGSASELAERAGVGFASAYRELTAMLRLGLVNKTRVDDALTYEANRAHLLAEPLAKLLAPTSQRPAPQKDDEEVRAELAALGAPVLTHKAAATGAKGIEDTLVAGAALAHRDPAVARALPVAIFRQRDRVDPERLASVARERSEKATVGLFLDLTAAVSGDRRFSRWARALRDRRVHAQRPFFYTRAAALRGHEARDRSPPQARRWGYRFDLALDDLQSMFDKAARAT